MDAFVGVLYIIGVTLPPFVQAIAQHLADCWFFGRWGSTDGYGAFAQGQERIPWGARENDVYECYPDARENADSSIVMEQSFGG